MSIMLGDLSVEEIERRIGIDFPEDIRFLMKKSHQGEAANIAEGCWHCFDIPFNMVCGDREIATIIFNSVKDRAAEVKEKLQFSIQTI